MGYLSLAFPVLIINMPMSGIRQAAAIGIMCFAYNAFNDRRLIRFVFCVIVASGFHSSAVSFLIFGSVRAWRTDAPPDRQLLGSLHCQSPRDFFLLWTLSVNILITMLELPVLLPLARHFELDFWH